MLMVGMVKGQIRVIGVWLRIIPIQPFSTTKSSVAIASDDSINEIKILPHMKHNILSE